MSRHLLGLGLLVAALVLAFCGDRSPVTPTFTPGPTRLTGLSVTGNTETLDVNQTSQLAAIASFSNGTSREVTAEARWGSVNSTIATVSHAGLLTAVALGRTVVYAEYQSRFDSVEVVVIPAGTYILSGTVVEPGPLPIGDATVEVVDGPHAGRSATTEGNRGRYEIWGLSGLLSMRASRPGYIMDTRTVSVTANSAQNFELRPMLPSLPVAGTYRLTFTASGGCASQLPEGARVRTYDARMNQTEVRLLVNVNGAQFALDPASGRGNSFFGTIRGNIVSFSMEDDYYYESFALVEQLGPTTYLTIAGNANGTAASSSIAGSLDGGFVIWEAPTGFYSARRRTASCHAGDHQFRFVR